MRKPGRAWLKGAGVHLLVVLLHRWEPWAAEARAAYVLKAGCGTRVCRLGLCAPLCKQKAHCIVRSHEQVVDAVADGSFGPQLTACALHQGCRIVQPYAET